MAHQIAELTVLIGNVEQVPPVRRELGLAVENFFLGGVHVCGLARRQIEDVQFGIGDRDIVKQQQLLAVA